MTVSATHDASAIATTASAAVPPSARISAPTAAVAGWPAATPGLIVARMVPANRVPTPPGALPCPYTNGIEDGRHAWFTDA